MTEKIVRYNPVSAAEVARGVFQPYPKLVRFQRTNHGWADGIYDDSLPCFHAAKGSREPSRRLILEIMFRIWNFGIISDFDPLGIPYENRDEIRISDFNHQEVVFSHQTENKKQFTHEISRPTHHCFPKSLFFFAAPC